MIWDDELSSAGFKGNLKRYSGVNVIHGLNPHETVLDSLSEIKLADR